eukprot:GILJ01002340.1.p1 GENE.GILJ01002340.1~~GILJ01002340.1.p1  ORF type:complete len:436 (+),score=87.75 GILJ01002340.1:48-1355(+)
MFLYRSLRHNLPKMARASFPLLQEQGLQKVSGVGAVRHLNLHEYQSKELMAKYGLRVQKGAVADTPDQAGKVASDLKAANAEELILKAQIHAGGRGKGHLSSGLKGGVKICRTPEEVKNFAKQMIGYTLYTHQTGPEGQPVSKVLVHEGITIAKEYYFAIVLDRKYGGPVLVASSEGGVDIEEVAEKNPDAILFEPIDIEEGVKKEQTDRLAAKLGFSGSQQEDASNQMRKLYDLFINTDATQVEINPLAVASTGKLYCVDAKINFDDNASFRQKDIFAMRDSSMEDPREVAAAKSHLNYIGLSGNIGCMVNGAGLAMATMDIIKLNGGEPANFLDVGGGANAKQVTEAFKILTSDPQVKALLVNIFGGIMKCDVIAEGIITAARQVGLNVPLVVRLAGTNVEKGQQMLRESGLHMIVASDLDDAAQKAVATLNQ